MKINRKTVYDQSGLTLVELLLTLAILSIVLLVAFNLFFFNLNVFNRGEALSEIQFDARMSTDFITTELRNVDLISKSDNSLANTLNLATLQAKYPMITDVQFELVKEGSDFFVEYTVESTHSSQNRTYELGSKVLLNNITSTTIGTTDTLYYRKQQ